MPTCCTALSGIARDCLNSLGGIRRVWIACYDDVTSKTVTNEMITAITATAGAFKEYRFRKNTANLTSTDTIDIEQGTGYWENVLVMQFNKMETSKRTEIIALTISDTVVIVEDANGKFWYLGFDEPVNASAGTGETGTVKADFNGYTVTLQDESIEPPYEVAKDVVDGLINEEED